MNPQYLAERGGCKAVLLQMSDHGIHLLYVFWLKMAKAFFKMSRSCSTRRSSFSSSCTRASNAVAAGPLVESRFAFQR